MNIHQAFNRPATEPILCSGNDLSATCQSIRVRGGFIEAMDVIGVSQYRLSYFLSGNKNGEGMAGMSSHPALAIQHSRKLDSRTSQSPATITGCNVRKGTEMSAESGASPDLETIEDRLSKLQTKLAKVGKILSNKPSTPTQHARTPHNSD